LGVTGIKISKDGCRVLGGADSPVLFRRYLAMDAFPAPVHGGAIKALRPLVNVSSDEDFVLLVARLLAALRSSGPYPVLVLSGKQVSVKRCYSERLSQLLTPERKKYERRQTGRYVRVQTRG